MVTPSYNTGKLKRRMVTPSYNTRIANKRLKQKKMVVILRRWTIKTHTFMHTINRKWTAELCTEYPFSIYVYDWVFVCMCVCGWGCLGACVFKLPVCSQWTTTHRIAYTVTNYSPSETVLSFWRCPVQRLSYSESDEQFQTTWDKTQHVHGNTGVNTSR